MPSRIRGPSNGIRHQLKSGCQQQRIKSCVLIVRPVQCGIDQNASAPLHLTKTANSHVRQTVSKRRRCGFTVRIALMDERCSSHCCRCQRLESHIIRGHCHVTCTPRATYCIALAHGSVVFEQLHLSRYIPLYREDWNSS